MNDLLLELDQKLACALGLEWSYGTTKRRTGDDWADWKWVGPQGALKNGMKLERWTESDKLCFQLIIEYELSGVGIWKNQAWVGSSDDLFFQCENLEEHSDKAEACRVAIVKAVIAKLETE